MKKEKSIMELLDDIVLLSKDLEVQCKDLKEQAFNFFPDLELYQKIVTKEE